MRRQKTQKMVLLANLLAIAIVLNIIESLYIRISPVPGSKIGFANIVTLIVIYLYGAKEATVLTILRIFLVSVLIGTFLSPTFYLGLGGAALSIVTMIILKKIDYFSIMTVSVLGSVAHAIGQILIGIPVLGSSTIIYWLPVMLLISIPAGLLTGAIANKFLVTWQATHAQNQ